jgi:hypothetical protein
MMRKLLNPAFLILLGILILLVGCSSGDKGPSARPSFTAPPENEGSAVLVYELSLEQKSSGAQASSGIGIPIFILIDEENTKNKDPHPIQGSTLADYYGRIGAMDRGKLCFIEFTYPVEYKVTGFYNPDPICDFDVKITASYKKDDIVKSGTCPIPLHETYPPEVLFVFPPLGPPEQNGMYKIPGSLPVVTMRDSDGVKITIELKNVVVPASSGCFFGG